MPINHRVRRLFAIVCAIIGIVPLLEAQGPLARPGTGVITGIVRDDTGRPVEYGSHVYRASHYSFDFQLLVRP